MSIFAILSVIALIFVLFGSVSAADVDTNDTELVSAIDDGEIVSVENDLDTLSADKSTYSELAKEIGSGGNIKLKHNHYIYDKGSTIEITNDNSVINGNGAIIDMNESNIQVFKVTAFGVTIKNLTINNANYNDNGGAICFTKSGTVENCNFINNTASNGGAIYFGYDYVFSEYGIRGTVENCNFINNKVASVEGDGGAICMHSGTITNCNFVNNFAWNGGAVNMGSGTVVNCSFANNSVGSAVLVRGDSEVINCNFTNNSASWQGGAIDFMSCGNVTGCNFINNSAKYGGAIYFDYFSSYSNVTNCNFIDNSAEYGGAVCFENSHMNTIKDCNFLTNHAAAGSAIYSSANLTISNSLFLNNRANVDDSAPLQIVKIGNNIYITFKGQNNLLNAIYSSSDVNFTNVTYWGANGITNTGSSPAVPSRSNKETGQNINVIVVVNDIILLNTTKVTDDNGQIILETPTEGRYTITAHHDADSYYSQAETAKTIVHPSNTYSELAGEIGFGGNVVLKHDYYSYDHGDTIKITVDNSVIDGNGAIIDMVGSTIQVFNITASGVTVKNLTIIDADFDGNGGAIYFSKQGCIENCNFVNNKASSGNGGAIYFNENATVSNCNFTNNVADWQGGAVYFNYDYDYYYRLTATIENCNFANNKAVYGEGGAIYFNYYSYYKEGPDYNFPGTTYYYSILGTIENCNFVNNAAEKGGAIYLIYSDSYGNTGNVTNCNFSENTAIYGGAIYFVGCGYVANCNFTSNQATVGGAIYFPEHSTGTVLNSKFTNNTAEKGGAIYIDYGTVENCNFINNKATSGDGGAIYVLNSPREIWDQTYTDYISHVTDCNFINNAAEKGGAVYLLNNCKATGCNFINNTAYCGGAIWIDRGTVANCSFISCSASNYGGGIYCFEFCKVYDCHFRDNTAKKGSNWWCKYSLINIEVPKVTATYGVSKKLTATLNDGNGKALKNKKVSVTVGTISKTRKTDLYGQISVDVSALVPGTYSASIKFKGDNNYKSSSASVKVTVKKATPKITAKAKTFKKTDKTKKYTVTLKNNKKLIKWVTVKITVNKKTYSAKTNSKGVATFKLTKLTKKAKFTATVKSVGNKYYNAKTLKNVKVTVK